jgi:hypothetical protein
VSRLPAAAIVEWSLTGQLQTLADCSGKVSAFFTLLGTN